MNLMKTDNSDSEFMMFITEQLQLMSTSAFKRKYSTFMIIKSLIHY